MMKNEHGGHTLIPIRMRSGMETEAAVEDESLPRSTFAPN